MDELIDITDTNGKPTGKSCLKSFAHQNGITHASVHIWLYTKKQQVLIQKRKATKDVYPSLWDVSVAGHIGSGELPVIAAIREVKEEIGYVINKQDLAFLRTWEDKHYHSNGIIDHEIHYIYLCELKHSLESLHIQKEEVEAINLMELNTFKEVFFDNNTFVPHPKEYYQYIIKKIQQRL